MKSSAQYQIPDSLIYRNDVLKAYRQIEAIVDGDTNTPISDALGVIVRDCGMDVRNMDHMRELQRIVSVWLGNEDDIVHIVVASEPSEAFVAKVIGWFRLNIFHSALADIVLDRSIVAGCDIRYRSHIYPMSVSSRISDARSQLKDNIRDMMP